MSDVCATHTVRPLRYKTSGTGASIGRSSSLPSWWPSRNDTQSDTEGLAQDYYRLTAILAAGLAGLAYSGPVHGRDDEACIVIIDRITANDNTIKLHKDDGISVRAIGPERSTRSGVYEEQSQPVLERVLNGRLRGGGAALKAAPNVDGHAASGVAWLATEP